MKLAMSSSGFSGVFSFGINTPKNYRDTAKSIDTALDYVFDISHKKTFLVNCIPMGVKVTTSLKIAETSVRPDMALALIKKFSPKFDQTLIVSDPHFLKKIVEDGTQEGIDWKKRSVSLVSGEDWFSESFRSYLAGLLGLDLDKPHGRLIGATMGIAELDLNLFHESFCSIQIRRAAQQNEQLRTALFGPGTKICPILFHYYPHRMFLEALPEGSADKELVFSMLSPNMLIPLMRYNSKDRGDIISYNKIKEILNRAGRKDLIPELKLPLVWVGGRKNRFMEIRGKKITPEEIKQGLYEDFQAASETTGYFRLNKEKQTLEIQLKRDVAINGDLINRFKKALLKYSDVDIPIEIYRYAEFPYAMELDYEKKFLHI
jgi:phenylacetate-CoA ligase